MQQAYSSTPVAYLGVDSRAEFIGRVYSHVLGSIVGFTLLEVVYFQTGIAEAVTAFVAGTSWLLVLGAFMVVSWLASRAANVSTSMTTQYAALTGFVAAESILFVPILYIASRTAPGVIESAAVVTLLGCAGLTAVAFITRRDFSFLRGMLMWGGILAVVAVVSAAIFGLELGTWFSVAMIGFAGAAVLYDTSNVLHHYSEDRYVAAALQLFASIALMFWYVLRLFMRRD